MKKLIRLMLLFLVVFIFIFSMGVSAVDPGNPFTILSTDRYSVDFSICNYSGGSTTNITISNLSDEAIKDWKLKWTFNEPSQISNSWCGNYTQTGKLVEVTPMPWNRVIAPKTSIKMGFDSTDPLTKPLDLTLLMAESVTKAELIGKLIPDVTALVNANSQFAFAIFKQLNTTETGKNIFISPFSISTALAMLYQGAASDTRDEMAKALHYSGLGLSQLNSDYKNLLAYLQKPDSLVTLNIANSIWYQMGFAVKPGFLNTNNNFFGAEIKNLDLTTAGAADTINDWVSKATNGMIDQIVNPPLPGVMYLINAIYFKGTWTKQFDPDLTRKATFTTESGKSNLVDMMSATDTIEFGKGTDYSAIRLPYGAGRVSMYCILPAEGLALDKFISDLSVAKFNEIKQSLSPRKNFSVKLPKFKMEYGVKSLETVLNTLGINKAFTPSQADFTGITDATLWVEDVLHKAVIDVNEVGSEAAASTVVILPTSVQDNFHAHRPFLFIIADDFTNTIMFMGKAADLVEY